MQPPSSLAMRMLILAADSDTGRIRSGAGSRKRQLVGAANLAELWMTGSIVDGGGYPIPTNAPPPRDDAALILFNQIATSRQPRSWDRWMVQQNGAVEVVQSQLLSAGIGKYEQRRALGLPAGKRFVIASSSPRQHLLNEIWNALRGLVLPPARVALTIALPAAAGVLPELTADVQRSYMHQLTAIRHAVEPLPSALERALIAAESSDSSSDSSGCGGGSDSSSDSGCGGGGCGGGCGGGGGD